jgi:hypothetical protein
VILSVEPISSVITGASNRAHCIRFWHGPSPLSDVIARNPLGPNARLLFPQMKSYPENGVWGLKPSQAVVRLSVHSTHLVLVCLNINWRSPRNTFVWWAGSIFPNPNIET